MAQEPVLFGRQAETAAIDALLDAAATGTSGSLVLLGEAGIGKTALLDHAARRSGTLRLLRAEGVEPEADLPFGGLHRLLLPVLDSIGALPPSQAAAIGAALGLGPGNGDRFLVGAGVLSLLSEVSGPAVSCAWWTTPTGWTRSPPTRSPSQPGGSRRKLPSCCSRRGRPAGSCCRGSRPCRWQGSPDRTRARCFDTARGLAGSVVDSVVRTSAGNPQALLELPAAMTAGQRKGAEPLPAELPLGERVQAAMMLRVAELPEPTRRLLLVVATDPAADLATLTAAATGLGLDLADLEPAERGGLVSTTAAGVRFGSPLLRSAVYADAPFLRRRAVHSALAETLHGSHPDRWAWHQAAIAQGPDPVLAGESSDPPSGPAAEPGRSHGSRPGTGGRVERRRAAPGPTVGGRRDVRVGGRSGRARRRTGDPGAGADAHPRAQWPALHGPRPDPDPPGPSPVGPCAAPERGRAAGRRRRRAVDDRADGRRRGRDDDRRLRRPAEDGRARRHRGRGQPGEQPGRGGADHRPGPVGPRDSAAGSASLRSFVDLVDPSDAPRVVGCRAAAASFLGDEATALRLYGKAIAAARAVGAVSSLPWLLEQRAVIEATSCQLLLAQADASEAVRLIEELGTDLPPLVGLASLTWVAAVRGNDDEAYLLADRVLVGAQQHGVTLPVGLVAAALMELDLARGRIESATARAVELADSAGTMHPLVTILTTPARVEILVRAGHPAPAADLAAHRAWARAPPAPPAGPSPFGVRRWPRTRRRPGPCSRSRCGCTRAPTVPDHHARTRLLYGEFLRRRRHPAPAGPATWKEKPFATLRWTPR